MSDMDCLTFGRRHHGGGGGGCEEERRDGRTGDERQTKLTSITTSDEHAKDDEGGAVGGGAIPHLMADALVVVLAGEIDSTRPLHLNRLTSTTLMFRSTG